MQNNEKIDFLLHQLNLTPNDLLKSNNCVFGTTLFEKLSQTAIGEQQQQVLTLIFDYYKDIYVTGSLSLLVNGVKLNREIKDVDLFTNDKKVFEQIQKDFTYEILEYEKEKEVNEVEPEESVLPEFLKLEHLTFRVNGIVVDVFHGDEVKTIYYDKIINDVSITKSQYPNFINVMNPIHSYDMKFKFVSDKFHKGLREPHAKHELPEYIYKHIDDLIQFLQLIKNL